MVLDIGTERYGGRMQSCFSLLGTTDYYGKQVVGQLELENDSAGDTGFVLILGTDPF